MDHPNDPAFVIMAFLTGVVIMATCMVLGMVWSGTVERIGMWYVVIMSGKPKPVYATKPPQSEGEVVSEHENYCDAIMKVEELRRVTDEGEAGQV